MQLVERQGLKRRSRFQVEPMLSFQGKVCPWRPGALNQCLTTDR
jgi:hypothetical protein